MREAIANSRPPEERSSNADRLYAVFNCSCLTSDKLASIFLSGEVSPLSNGMIAEDVDYDYCVVVFITKQNLNYHLSDAAPRGPNRNLPG